MYFNGHLMNKMSILIHSKLKMDYYVHHNMYFNGHLTNKMSILIHLNLECIIMSIIICILMDIL